jgi:hypothetical protein
MTVPPGQLTPRAARITSVEQDRPSPVIIELSRG